MTTPTNLLVKHYAGSIAYGTNTPTSDTDFRGIFVAAPECVRTPFYPVKQVEDVSEEDTVFYELSQFMKLAIDCNPNVIETLWVHPNDVVLDTPAYQLLREAAPKLLTQKIAHTTTGYAMSQLHRIKGHKKWIMNPQPESQPQQIDFISLVHNFTHEKVLKLDCRSIRVGYKLVPYGNEIYGVYPEVCSTLFNKETGSLNESDPYSGKEAPAFIVKYNKAEHVIAKERWKQYWTWKQERNPVRSALEEKHGFDCKHAMHLVRLLRMGAEALTTGQIIVKRPDAAELLAIRNGSMTYDEIVDYAEQINNDIKTTLLSNTSLPKRVDLKFASKLMMDIQDSIWSSK
jgi:predicted nucleotidyltransferase